MSFSFDWEFEEEEVGAPRRLNDGPRRSNRRLWLIRGLAAALILAAIGLGVRAWVDRRMNAIKQVEAGLRSAVEFELKTIAEGDGELFRSRQDPNDSDWQARQLARYITDPAAFAPAPGLTPADRPPEIKAVHVLGRTGRAELIHYFQNPQSLIQNPKSKIQNPLPFHTTWFYRQAADGLWYHVAPPKDYWGADYSWHGTRLGIFGTRVESAVLDPLARELATLVVQGCRLLDCPAEARYELRFDARIGPRLRQGVWSLPPLYLAGLPEGGAAQAAWESALEMWLIEALAQAQIDNKRVTERVLYRQLVTQLQVELDLTAPPATDAQMLTQAVLDGKSLAFQNLWRATFDPDDLPGNHLLQAGADALLHLVEQRVGRERLFELLPALSRYRSLEQALDALYGLDYADVKEDWLAFLFELGGIATSQVSAAAATPTPTPTPLPPLEPPPPPPALTITPGDQIAFICDGRVWVGNADGSNLVRLTANAARFDGLYWSPDGRWLLTGWQNQARSIPSSDALYLLATDGSQGHLLTDDPELQVWPIGWSPDGREAVYYAWDGQQAPRVEAIEISTGRSRTLPGEPFWSPDGKHLAYVSDPFEGRTSAIWLADPSGENARQIVSQFQRGTTLVWSPDSSRLALVVDNAERGQVAIALYDLETASLTPLVTAADLAAALASGEDFITDGSDLIDPTDRPLQVVWPVGWSADGKHLLVWAQATTNQYGGADPTLLAVAPTDSADLSATGRPAPRVLAFGRGVFLNKSPWSPADPNRLAFGWPSPVSQFGSPNAYVFDLQTGPIYTTTAQWESAWSLDGRWAAFGGSFRVSVINPSDQSHFTLGSGGQCLNLAWNPVADLSALGAAPAFSVAEPDWSFANLRLDWDVREPQSNDADASTLHVWGEIVNYTTHTARSVRALIPRLYDAAGAPLTGEGDVTFPPGYVEMLEAVTVPEGGSLPFGFTMRLPAGVSLENDHQIIVGVQADAAATPRDDLDIAYDSFNLSAWPERFGVHAIFENPNQPFDEYVALVATLYYV
jgi:hypothetical protein